jgi:hypothetical protein
MAEDLMDDGKNEDSAGSFNEVDSISSGDDTTLDEESAPNSEPKVFTSFEALRWLFPYDAKRTDVFP